MISNGDFRKREKIKHLKRYQILYTEFFYRLLRAITRRQIINSYAPLVLGKENIPIKGAADVFVCNHRNIKDPLIMIALLKNPIHFTALKRMFEYNENIFGTVGKNIGTFLTTISVKLLGTLPIARPSDRDYIFTNLQTVKYIDEYLKSNSAIAIFPEGTLNREPGKNGNILPLKSNRAFRIAEEGKGVIRPVAITWLGEETKIRNKVIICFLKPIKTEGLKAWEIKEKWERVVNNAIECTNQMALEILKINGISIN